ncbi:MAG: peptidylprolyl isomerase [Luteolibacter sp.]|uniref:peptidylprolyl isomerase n=1 Tax=Luteolibacter sp. TaxID=1962973 RepID=UPI003265957D
MKTALLSRTSQSVALLMMTSAISKGTEGLPSVVHPLPDIAAAAAANSKVIALDGVFKLDGIDGDVARFATSKGNMDVELFKKDAPKTVANFLKYVKRGTYSGTFIHFSDPDFVFQGGNYSLVDGETTVVIPDAPVANEFKVSNTRGTIGMSKFTSDPDSATNQWFFNESNENAAKLDHDNGGYTVFGKIIGQKGLHVMDTIGALPVENLGYPFDHLPVVNHKKGDPITNKNLVEVKSIKVIPLLSGSPKGTALLKLSVSKNSNPAVVKASVSGKSLILKYPGKSGKAVIDVTAEYSGGGTATDSFTVTKK